MTAQNKPFFDGLADTTDLPRVDTVTGLILAENALWDLLDHLTESSVPAETWNNAVTAIDAMRSRLHRMGAGQYCICLDNFRPIEPEDIDIDGYFSVFRPGFHRHATSGVRSKPGIDSVGDAETP